ncbi:PD-(D/E)XK nuclease family transposase [Pajaroellobacter abortibovis]|uniref:Uncharacterized protein n=1 Tax=Pajaroellobacter abortibovis TaxID=1882918 RepID=A0A1L6MZ41_9BACT|nr:PD-(D/E)XK nuclease family transposase [Pajaroellobacter abortibovis]APS00655.1 hypothetical protein BCY86_08200 [Pajaroellobacter abortibovis]
MCFALMTKGGNTVEIQVAYIRGFEKRAQYYATKAYISQMKKGDIYQNLKEIIFLAIINFVMFKESPDYKSDHVILDRKFYEIISRISRFVL